jgi:hypothetical protein
MQGKHLGQLNLSIGRKRPATTKIATRKKKAIGSVREKLLDQRIDELKVETTQIETKMSHSDFVAQFSGSQIKPRVEKKQSKAPTKVKQREPLTISLHQEQPIFLSLRES